MHPGPKNPMVEHVLISPRGDGFGFVDAALVSAAESLTVAEHVRRRLGP